MANIQVYIVALTTLLVLVAVSQNEVCAGYAAPGKTAADYLKTTTTATTATTATTTTTAGTPTNATTATTPTTPTTTANSTVNGTSV